MADPILVQEKPPGEFTELQPFTAGLPTTIIAGDPPVAHSWDIVRVWSEAQLRAVGIYFARPADLPPYKVLVRYHFQRVGLTVAQIADELADLPPPPPDILAIAQGANERIDAGVEAGKRVLAELEAERPSTRREMSEQEQIDALQAQLDTLAEALRSTLQAQVGRAPRDGGAEVPR